MKQQDVIEDDECVCAVLESISLSKTFCEFRLQESWGFGVPRKELSVEFLRDPDAVKGPVCVYGAKGSSVADLWGKRIRGLSWWNASEGRYCFAFYQTKAQDEALKKKELRELQKKLDADRAVPIPPTGHPVYEWRDGMREVSGFGGLYEGACRKMVAAGCARFDTHPDADPQFHGWPGIYGVICEDNDDARALAKVLADACLFVRKNGWEKYVQEMSK